MTFRGGSMDTFWNHTLCRYDGGSWRWWKYSNNDGYNDNGSDNDDVDDEQGVYRYPPCTHHSHLMALYKQFGK